MYDNNVLSGKIDEARLEQYLDDPKKPLVNHALAEQYAPGSIFKQITGAAALQEGVATPSSTIIVSNGYIKVPNQYDPSISIRSTTGALDGVMNFYGASPMSSDVYFYYLAGGYHALRPELRRPRRRAPRALRPPVRTRPQDRHRHRRGGRRQHPGHRLEEGDLRRRLVPRRYLQHGYRPGVRRHDADPDGARRRRRRERRHAADPARRPRSAATPSSTRHRLRRTRRSKATSASARRTSPIIREAYAQAVSPAAARTSASSRGRGRRQDRNRRVRPAVRPTAHTRRTPGSAGSPRRTIRRSRLPCSSSEESARRTRRRSPRRSSTTTSTANYRRRPRRARPIAG